MTGFIKRVLEKPLPIIWFRIRQALGLAVISRLGLWQRYSRSAEKRWADGSPALQRFRADGSSDALISDKNLGAVRDYLKSHADVAERMARNYKDVSAGRLQIFGQAVVVPPDPDKPGRFLWPWSCDWRFDHQWPEGPPGSFGFYDFEKTVPYDVKFPWEVSRLGFLVSPTLWATLEGHADWWDQLSHIIDDWHARNPIAHTISWNPMECSVRGISLVYLVMLARSAGDVAAGVLPKLLSLCETHGKFVYRTIEYTDVRGNHFAANITSLILLGDLLQDEVGEARKWLAYGREHLEDEILLQFCDDGVQFEKSIPYHRFVLQLFLVSAMTLDKAGSPLSNAARERLSAACRYVAAYTRPDGTAPVWGDNDDASIFPFDCRDLSDHQELPGLAAAYLGQRFRVAGDDQGASVPIEVPLLVAEGIDLLGTAANIELSEVEHYPAGGMVIVRRSDAFFMTDVGEVGLMGRGGHGHLDALSFELALGGQPIIIDPGSYVYTADAEARHLFRSTTAHNVVRIDGQEMATSDPRAMWRLGAEADPYDVQVEDDGQVTEISARHDGYMGLDDPVAVARRFQFDRARQYLEITDTITGQEGHVVERSFHFAPGLTVDLKENLLSIVSRRGVRVTVNWSSGTATLEDDWVSRNYGSKMPGQTLRLRDEITKSEELQTRIYLETPET